MKNLICILFALLNGWVGLYAQNIINISGVVVVPEEEVSMGSVLVLHPVDSSFIKGVSFFNSEFEIEKIDQPEVILKFTSLQFDDTYVKVAFTGSPTINLGHISVKTEGVSLDAVIINGRKPIFVQKIDGTVEVLIENTTLAASNSAHEILSKVPEVMVGDDGGLSIFGKGDAILYLNGKRIDNNQLSMIMPSNIKKIEVIRNPSAKYDAEGGAVIQITTLTVRDNGYQGTFMQNVSHSGFGGNISNTSLNLNYKKGKLSSHANYSLQLGEERELLHTTRNRTPENNFLTTDLTSDWNRKFNNYSYYGLGLQYDLKDKSYVSIEYTGFLESLGGITNNTNQIVDDIGKGDYKSEEIRNERDINNSISLNYARPLDTLGSTLFIGGQFSDFNIETDNPITEESIEGGIKFSRLLRSERSLDVSIYSGQIDFTKVFKNASAFDAGVRYTYVDNGSNVRFSSSTDGTTYKVEDALSNSFFYFESVGAAYLSFKSKINEKTDYAIGLRGEFTQYDLQLIQLEDKKIKDAYLSIFPNLSLNRQVSDKYKVNLSYTSRITRVPYHNLNPVLIYQDPYTSIQGNPNLVPTITHTLEINNKIGKTNVRIGYSYVNNPRGGTAERGSTPKSYVLRSINYDKSNAYFASVTRGVSMGIWSSQNTVSLRYLTVSEEELGFEKITPKPNIYLYSNHRFNLTESFKAEALIWFRGDNIEGLHHRNKMNNVTLTLEKSFFKNALTCRFIANDIFHGRISSGTYNVGKTDIYYNRRWSTRNFRLSLSYNFGKLKESSYKNKAVGDSENNRAQ